MRWDLSPFQPEPFCDIRKGISSFLSWGMTETKGTKELHGSWMVSQGISLVLSVAVAEVLSEAAPSRDCKPGSTLPEASLLRGNAWEARGQPGQCVWAFVAAHIGSCGDQPLARLSSEEGCCCASCAGARGLARRRQTKIFIPENVHFFLS